MTDVDNWIEAIGDALPADGPAREAFDSLVDRIDDLTYLADGQIADAAAREDALVAVKYWMHDVLVLRRPMMDPRKILRMVEDALG